MNLLFVQIIVLSIANVFAVELSEILESTNNCDNKFITENYGEDAGQIPGYSQEEVTKILTGYELGCDVMSGKDVDEIIDYNVNCGAEEKTLPYLNKTLRIEVECETIPDGYQPKAVCSNQTIKYNNSLPTYGDYRPMWARYGSFLLLPPQRWLHNLKHGAVVMLYHRCTSRELVEQLEKIVDGCLPKYVITNDNSLPEDMPLALVTWGCRYRMNGINETHVKDWIRERAFRGVDCINADGVYSKYQIAGQANMQERNC